MRTIIRKIDDPIDVLAKRVHDFAFFNQKLDIELVALRHKYEILAARVARLEGVPA